MSDTMKELARPFPDNYIHSNPSGGGSYVKHHVVEQRLIMVLGYPPEFEKVEIIYGDVPAIKPNPNGKSQRAKDGRPELKQVIVGVVCRMTAFIAGKDRIYEEVGDCEEPHNWSTDGQRLKDAMSDAYKRCLVAGTLIWTKRGQVPIEAVCVGDEVMTRGGWRRVSVQRMTAPADDTVTVHLSDGSQLRGTANHPVYVQGEGFVYLGKLQRGAILFSWRDLRRPLAKKWSSEASHIGATSVGATSPDGTAALRWPSIALFTRLTTALSRRAGTFITRIATRATTHRRTSWRLTQTPTLVSTRETTEASTESASSAAAPTTPATSVGRTSGVRHLVATRTGDGPGPIQRNEPVSYAARASGSLSKLRIVVERAERSAPNDSATAGFANAKSAEPTSSQSASGLSTAPVVVVSVEENGRAPVWNLTVEDRNEFFANGILTHNCAMRLGCGLHLWSQDEFFLFDKLSAGSSKDEPKEAAGPRTSAPAASSPQSQVTSGGADDAQTVSPNEAGTDAGSPASKPKQGALT